jgi:hypothetical protein
LKDFPHRSIPLSLQPVNKKFLDTDVLARLEKTSGGKPRAITS